MRVLVTGSRTWTDRGAVWAALDAVVTEGRGQPVVVVHGACPGGADAHAAAWVLVRRRWGWAVTEERHPAAWGQGRDAGMRRNLAMVQSEPELCLAFIDRCRDERCRRREVHGSHGASHCARMAERAGIPVRRLVSEDLVDALMADRPAGLREQVEAMLAGAVERLERPAQPDDLGRLQGRLDLGAPACSERPAVDGEEHG